MKPAIPAPPFAAMMQRFHGEIERQISAAEVACEKNGGVWNCLPGCPFEQDHSMFSTKTKRCIVPHLRELIGEHRPPGLCQFAAWLDGYYLCKSQDECEFQEGAGLTFYCGREAEALAVAEEPGPCPKCGSPTFTADIDDGMKRLCMNDACKWIGPAEQPANLPEQMPEHPAVDVMR